VGKIGRDQVDGYARRKEMEVEDAYSGPIRPLILIEIGHPFWFKPATDSG
jgi:hypothetical protein